MMCHFSYFLGGDNDRSLMPVWLKTIAKAKSQDIEIQRKCHISFCTDISYLRKNISCLELTLTLVGRDLKKNVCELTQDKN